MKKVYEAPKLTIHGNVEKLTQVFGSSSAQDFLFFAGSPINDDADPGTPGFTDGSNDLNLIIG